MPPFDQACRLSPQSKRRRVDPGSLILRKGSLSMMMKDHRLDIADLQPRNDGGPFRTLPAAP
jgi:hypothetical protein